MNSAEHTSRTTETAHAHYSSSASARTSPTVPTQTTQTASPELPTKETGPHGGVVYFSSASGNTARFVHNCDFPSLGLEVTRIPLLPHEPTPRPTQPFILIVPTYGGGNSGKAVPVQVKHFLNAPENRKLLRGVIASGNTNFGEAYGMAGDIVSAKCHVPLMYRFELMGTPEDVQTVRKGITDFFSTHK